MRDVPAWATKSSLNGKASAQDRLRRKPVGSNVAVIVVVPPFAMWVTETVPCHPSGRAGGGSSATAIGVLPIGGTTATDVAAVAATTNVASRRRQPRLEIEDRVCIDLVSTGCVTNA